MLVASILGPQIGHFFDSLEHKISPIGLAAIGLAVVALIAYVVLWLMSRYQRPSLAAVLEPYRMTRDRSRGCRRRPPIITVPWLQTVRGQGARAAAA